MKLWIDDLRTPPDDTWDWVQTSDAAIALMRTFQDADLRSVPMEAVSFDHDLGGDDTSRRVVLWMIENDFTFKRYNVHSANPVGQEWLVGMIERYLA